MHGAQPDNPTAPLRTSLVRAGLALVVIACGLSLRWYGFPLGLPAFVVKYGGSLLWATMVFLLVGVLLPKLPRPDVMLHSRVSDPQLAGAVRALAAAFKSAAR